MRFLVSEWWIRNTMGRQRLVLSRRLRVCEEQ